MAGIFFSLQPSYALDALPNPHSTIATYCSSGTCSTGGTQTSTNATMITSVSQKNSNHISIVESQTCLTLIKNHMNSTCIPYQNLKYLDTTNPVWAGIWVDTPYTHRLEPKVKNHFIFDGGKLTVMVDPNNDFIVNSKVITIQDKNFTWINPDDSSKGGISTITHINRYVSDCQTAIVAPIKPLIEDTITYLQSGCTKTSFNDTKIIIHKDIPFSWNNPYSSLHYQDQLKQLLHGHSLFSGNKTAGGLGPGNLINSKSSYHDPNHNTGFGWK